MNLPDKPIIPCFLCGRTLKVKMTKSDKPYFICDTCGLQAFIRYKSGIRHFTELLYSLAEDGEILMSINESSFKVVNLVSRLNELNKKLDQLRENKSLTDYFRSDTEFELAEKALEKNIRAVKKALRDKCLS